LKKRIKKLLDIMPGLSGETAAKRQKSFASFLQKRSACLFGGRHGERHSDHDPAGASVLK
jgi:hypothetical protein